MANRLSTAEILAAARAADGSGSRGTKTIARAAGSELPVESPNSSASVAVLEPDGSTEDFTDQTTPEGNSPADRNGKAVASTPPSVSKLIAAARDDAQQARQSANAPPSMASIFAELRAETPPALPAPPSMARMLADIRGGSAVTPVNQTSSKKEAASDSRASQPNKSGSATGRGSTASILAAARKQGAGGGKPSGKPPASPTGENEKPSGTASILAAARKQGGARSAKPPAKTSASPVAEKPSGTAAILAAARKQGGAATAAAPSPAKKPSQQPARAVSERNNASKSAVGDADRADGRPRPARIAEILAQVRCENPAELAPSELPSLVEMMASLRHLSEQQSTRRGDLRSTAVPWTDRVRDWFAGRKNRIAVRQFDHS